MKYIIIVDAQNDFISGSLKCNGSDNAIKNIVKFINNNDYNTIYSLDWHSKTNKSFTKNGGIWPEHCLVGSSGGQIHNSLYKLKDKNKIPNKTNMFYKGINDEIEEYSAYYARNDQGRALCEIIKQDDEIIICGFALDYCVKETINELVKNNYKDITIYKNMLGYVNEADRDKALLTLNSKGIKVI